MTKNVTISEEEYATLLAQGAFIRAAVYALGGQYEVDFKTMAAHGRGQFEMGADQSRGVIFVKLIQGPHEVAPDKPQNERTREKVASSAAKILNNPRSTLAEKSAAASALTQRRGRDRITRPGVEDDD